jgi:hypothetical protein
MTHPSTEVDHVTALMNMMKIMTTSYHQQRKCDSMRKPAMDLYLRATIRGVIYFFVRCTPRGRTSVCLFVVCHSNRDDKRGKKKRYFTGRVYPFAGFFGTVDVT